MSEPLPGAVERVLEAARAVVLTWRQDDPQYVRSSNLLDDFDVLEVALAAIDDPPATTGAASPVGALRVGAGGGSSIAAGRDVGDTSGCIAEGREGNTGDVRGLSGSLAPASDQGLLLSRRHETSHDCRGAAHPVAGIKPGHPLATPALAADAEHDALIDLLHACALTLARRDAQGRGAARARLRESMAAAQGALGLDAPPVIKCTPVRPEVTLRGETDESR